MSQIFTVLNTTIVEPSMDLSIQKRILLVPDQINGKDSGGYSARAAARILALGYLVSVYAMDALVDVHDDVKSVPFLYAPPTALRWYEFIWSPKLSAHFTHVLVNFRANYVFVGGLQKPTPLAREARKRGIKTIFLFYINEFLLSKSLRRLT